ncbi:cell division ATP-binding protein FtsE [uncultured Neptuniibacter sp.]|uniref:cell division ATP-binding protein FtsE n=1 Tax=uncultured Neptuniibacter sp. TaxID=502143 RepID=UPI002616F395|nr:cell division ATP-binding protein FtsE [uncultured Neptuniibacter sp.]
MIQFENVSKRYPEGHDALRDISFTLDRGEMAFLTGHSGAGKSTLLKLIMLMERPTRGQVSVAHHDLAQFSRDDIPYHRRRIGVVFQNHQLLFDRSVFENIALPLQISGYEPEDVGKRVRAALDKVGLLSKEKHNPVALSTGEQQRIGIARAIVHKPQLLLADEPTGNLDPTLSAEIMSLFMEFNRHGTTVLIASHDLALISRMGHRTLTLDQGRLLRDGRT